MDELSEISLSKTTPHSAKSSETQHDPVRMLKAFFEVRRIQLTPDALRMWIDALSDLSRDEISECIRRFNRESTEYPTPAAVRRYAGATAASLDDRATVAWCIVRREISRTGAYESIEFDDLMTNAAIRAIGGWERLCEVETDQIQWKEREFLAAYRAACRTGIGDGSPLSGIVERSNAPKGLECPDPKRIRTGLRPHSLSKRLTYLGKNESTRRIGPAAELAKRITVQE